MLWENSQFRKNITQVGLSTKFIFQHVINNLNISNSSIIDVTHQWCFFNKLLCLLNACALHSTCLSKHFILFWHKSTWRWKSVGKPLLLKYLFQPIKLGYVLVRTLASYPASSWDTLLEKIPLKFQFCFWRIVFQWKFSFGFCLNTTRNVFKKYF